LLIEAHWQVYDNREVKVKESGEGGYCGGICRRFSRERLLRMRSPGGGCVVRIREGQSVADGKKRHYGKETEVEMVTLQAVGRLEEYPPPQKDIRPCADRPDVLDRYRPPDVPDDLLSPKSSMGSNPRSPVGPSEGLTGKSDPPEEQRILARIKLVAAGVVGASLYKHRITRGPKK
jgi:hypothetical protein